MREIELSNSHLKTTVDEGDCAAVSDRSWYLVKRNGDLHYAYTSLSGRPVNMHNFILDSPEGYEIDHKNRNGLDNRRRNLRVCKHAENLYNKRKYKNNKSGYKGVYWETRPSPPYRSNKGSWAAQLRIRGKKKFLGYFNTAERAARAYDIAAKKYFGEFARLNF